MGAAVDEGEEFAAEVEDADIAAADGDEFAASGRDIGDGGDDVTAHARL